MDMQHTFPTRLARIADALASGTSTIRQRAALAAGTEPDPRLIAVLVDRCGREPDFFVRDTLTWALTRNDRALVVPAVLAELSSPNPQARSQALHTLSKIADPATWSAISPELLTDPDDEVARSALRAAVVLVPDDAVEQLADTLATGFGRGDTVMKRSLSRAFIALGDQARGAVRSASASADADRRAHAAATERLMDDPESEFLVDVEEAKRISTLGT